MGRMLSAHLDYQTMPGRDTFTCRRSTEVLARERWEKTFRSNCEKWKRRHTRPSL